MQVSTDVPAAGTSLGPSLSVDSLGHSLSADESDRVDVRMNGIGQNSKNSLDKEWCKNITLLLALFDA